MDYRSSAEGALVEAPRGVNCGKGVLSPLEEVYREGLDPSPIFFII